MALEDLVKTVMSELKSMVKTETVVGQPVKAGETVIIPVSKVTVGFGAGGGDGKDGATNNSGSGSGTGGGASIEPIAFIVVNPQGKAQLLPVTQKEITIGKIIDSIPDILAKFGFGEKNTEENPGKKDAKNSDEEPTFV
ncbi:sporulation protein [bacterium]|nr:sporulation protein [bacterium]